MKKKILGLVLVFTVLGGLLFTLSGCGNTDESSSKKKSKDNDIVSDVQENNVVNNTNSSSKSNQSDDDDFDFSAYESHGKFSDGLAWVKVSDYSGEKMGYINKNGEYVIPLSDKYKTLRDFENGTAVVTLKSERSIYGNILVINTKGEELARIEDDCGSDVKYKSLNNGNILFGYPLSMSIAQDWYMYIAKTKTLINLSADNNNVVLTDKCADYVEGLLYSGDEFNSFAADGCSVRFLDEEGNCALYLGRSTEQRPSNENYKEVYSASDFKDGKSNIIFLGQNNKRYTVTVDKQGNWQNEPKEVDDQYKVR